MWSPGSSCDTSRLRVSFRCRGDDGGTWRATPRFRIAVTSMVEDSAVYAALLTLVSGPAVEGDET
jgi:hypothetical protein